MPPAKTLYSALEKGESSQSGLTPLVIHGVECSVRISVRPASLSELEGFVVVLFEEYDEQTPGANHDPIDEDHKNMVRALEEELSSVRKRLQTTVEEFETSKEEMKASH